MKKLLSCPQCNNFLPEDSAFCQYCGASIEPQSLDEVMQGASDQGQQENVHYISYNKYCSKCGGVVEAESKRCKKCGKQYFYWGKVFNKKTVLPIILAFFLLLSVIANVVMATDMQEYKLIIEDQSRKIYGLEYQGFEDWLEGKELDFYREHVVLVSDDRTNYYHTYGCSEFDDSYFWMYNSEYAESKGYVPCPYCHN